MKILEQIEIVLRAHPTDKLHSVYIDVYDNSLSRKWLPALESLIEHNYHLEKNYCFFGFSRSARDGELILSLVNQSIDAINKSGIGYQIDDIFSMENCITTGEVGYNKPGRKIIQEKFNALHRYFEDLQGVSGRLSSYVSRASAETQWHIRQLNLLCHEFESWAMSYRKEIADPPWQRPSQLMCWLNAPRFVLDEQDYELFGIETINRKLGGVFVGVNKAVGKHHWEVFQDEGRDSRINELVTSTLRSQTEAAGDFDIEWANNPGDFFWQQKQLGEFREWLLANGFDPNDKSLTIGHPQVAQVDLTRSFGSTDYQKIWDTLYQYLDVYEIKTSAVSARYDYHWSDPDFAQTQIEIIKKGKTT
jgi:hypothetical protein